MSKIYFENKAQLTGLQGAVYTLSPAFEPHCFFSGDGDGKVVKWNLQQLDTATVLADVPSNIFSLGLLTEAQLLAIGSLQGILYLIDLSKRQLLEPSYQLDGAIYVLQQHHRKLYIGTSKGQLYQLDIENKEIIHLRTISTKSIRTIVCHPSSEYAAIGCSDHNIYLLDLKTHQIRATLTGHKNSVFALHFSSDGQYLFSGGRDALLNVWDLQASFSLLESIQAHLFTINSIVESPSKKWLATGSRDKSIKIWSSSDLSLQKVIEPTKGVGHLNSVNKLLWLDFEKILLSASDDRSIMGWQFHAKE